jgi:hypothetical protein
LQFAGEIGLASDDDDSSIYHAHQCRHARCARTGGLPLVMRVTIIKRPHRTINGLQFRAWRVGETYDVSADIATLLIIEGYAQLEMRGGADRRRAKRWGEADRRHQGELDSR